MDNRFWRPPPKKPYSARDPKITSAMMSAVRSKGNKGEIALRKELWRRGFRYRLYVKVLIGRPDIVFPRARVAVFVDGDFWHGRALLEDGEGALRATLRTARQEWWIAKLRRTVQRDAQVTDGLKGLGWKVIRVWESSVIRDHSLVADRIERILRKRGHS